jgi:hypothetical protein
MLGLARELSEPEQLLVRPAKTIYDARQPVLP